MVASASPFCVHVRHWRNHLLVASDDPAPERARDPIADVLRRELAAPEIDGLPATADELVFVRRLDLDLTVDAAWDGDAIARAVASALAGELTKAMAVGDPGNLIRFGSRAEYVAHYVTCRARSDGAPPWFFRSFEGWSALPASAAIRSALCDEPEVGRTALGLLAPPALSSIATALTRVDADLIARALAPADACAASTPTLRAVLVACAAEPPPLDGPVLAATSERERTMTRFGGAFLLLDDLAEVLLDDVGHAWPSLGGVAATTALRAIVLGHCFGAERWPGFVGDPFWRDLCGLPPTVTARALADWLNDLGRRPLRSFRRAIARSADGRDPSGPHRILLQEALNRRWRVVTDDEGNWLTLGRARAPSATASDAESDDVAYLVDDSGPLSTGWACALAVAARRILRRFGRRLPGFSGSHCRFLRHNFLDVTATVDREADRLSVVLSRPPLDLMLGLTGRNRGERRWPWLDGRPFVLHAGD